MILLRSYVQGFGKLVDRTFQFRDGLNLLFAPNEGGKSTLQRFLVGLLYGQLRSDLRTQRRLDGWAEQYKPWEGSEYGGILWLRLANGRELEIHRAFGKDETAVDIRTATGESITAQYERQRNGELLFARLHLGLPKELFESIAVIGENRTTEIHGQETIRDRIANLAQSGDEELSIQQSLSFLGQALDRIGSERAPTKPYKQMLDRIDDLRTERSALEEMHTRFETSLAERSSLTETVASLEKQLEEAHRIVVEARWRSAAHKVQILEELEQERVSLRSQIESLGPAAEFPVHRMDELNHLLGSQETLRKHLAETRSLNQQAQAHLQQVENGRKDYLPFAELIANNEVDRVTEWFVSYLGQSIQKDNAHKSIAVLKQQRETMEESLKHLGPALRDPSVDWQRKARETAEEERTLSEESNALAEKIAKQTATFSELTRSNRNKKVLAALLMACAVGIATLNSWSPQLFLSTPIQLGAGAALAIVAIVVYFGLSSSAQSENQLKSKIRELNLEQGKLREKAAQSKQEISDAITASGFKSLEEFLAAAKETENKRHRLLDLTNRIEESISQADKQQESCDELLGNLKNSLGKVGLVCSPGNLKSKVDMMRASVRRYREIDAVYQGCLAKVQKLESEETALARESEQNSNQIQSMLSAAGVNSPDEFREQCRKSQLLLELNDKATARDREFQRVCGGLSPEEWKKQVQVLESEKESFRQGRDNAEDSGNSGHIEPLLPYLPTADEAEEEERQIAAQLSSACQEKARVAERVKQAFQNCRSISEIEEDLSVAEEEHRELEVNRQALQIALDTIRDLSRQQQEILAPQLNAVVEQRFLRLAGPSYEEVKIDPDFQAWVRESGTGKLRPCGQLSRGTQDQMYFALRFGLLDLMGSETEPCPCLLDEAFAAYDRKRLEEAFAILKQESTRRQLLVFTCREDICEFGEASGANIIALNNTVSPTVGEVAITV